MRIFEAENDGTARPPPADPPPPACNPLQVGGQPSSFGGVVRRCVQNVGAETSQASTRRAPVLDMPVGAGAEQTLVTWKLRLRRKRQWLVALRACCEAVFPALGQLRPDPAESLPTSAQVCRAWTECGQTSVKLGRNRPTWAVGAQIRANTGAKGAICPEEAYVWSWARCLWRSPAWSCVNGVSSHAVVGRCPHTGRPNFNFGKKWPDFDRCWPISAKFGPVASDYWGDADCAWLKSGPMLSVFGEMWPVSARLGPDPAEVARVPPSEAKSSRSVERAAHPASSSP